MFKMFVFSSIILKKKSRKGLADWPNSLECWENSQLSLFLQFHFQSISQEGIPKTELIWTPKTEVVWIPKTWGYPKKLWQRKLRIVGKTEFFCCFKSISYEVNILVITIKGLL